MIDRRRMLLSVSALAATLPSAAAAEPTPGEKLDGLFDAFMAANLDALPEDATALGLDTGARAWEASRLNGRSPAAVAQGKARLHSQLQQVLAFDRASLSERDRIDYDVVVFGMQAADVAARRYDYGPVAAGIPYVISQLTGAYVSVPDFLDGQHRIESKADADAYLARLAAFATAMDEEIQTARHDAAAGCIPPDFALAKTREQMMRLRSVAPQDAGLVTSVARRAQEKSIPGDYAGLAARIVSEKIYPALDRQLALVGELQAQATHDAGVWKFPNGDQYYADSVVTWTTSPLDPLEIHRIGVDFVADRTARLDAIMKQQGMTTGSVAERLRGMFADPRFRYPNTDDGKARLLADLNSKVAVMRARLPQYFGVLPKAGVVVKPVPKYMEAARPGGYYQPPSLDGARPGAFYVNVRDTAETPTWILPTHTYHESLPGHHLKGSVYQEAKLPLIRKSDFYSAYMEGWSIYAEQLADEMGMYDDDPFGRIGYLHGALRAGVALVADTGVHAMHWSREQAIRYRVETLGDPVSSATTEVERYSIWPGQACSYVLDLQAILKLRSDAQAALGPRFDIRQFHDAVLLCGPVPLKVLDEAVGDYIAARRL